MKYESRSRNGKIEIIVKEHEEKLFPFIWINGDETEVSVSVRLIGEGANLKLLGIFLGTNSSSVIFNTHVSHEAKNTKSLTTIRGVFLNKSLFNNDGMVYIQKGAKGADGYFASKILLFEDAKGKSVPSLEIDENEIKAGHASTVGRPDLEQLFYLQSRGLSEKEAEKLIISGFFEPILNLLPTEQKNQTKKSLVRALWR